MAQPSMQPLLGRDSQGKRPSIIAMLEAIVMIILLIWGFWEGVHSLQHAIHFHPLLATVFPLFGASALALLLPFLLFLSFRSEFAGLHPAWPPHYAFLVRRLLRALSSSNQLKVSAKEL